MSKNIFEETTVDGNRCVYLWSAQHDTYAIIDLATRDMLSKDYPRNTWRFTNNGILTSRERTTVYLHNIIINNDIRYEQISKGNDYRPANLRPRTGNDYPARAAPKPSDKPALPPSLVGKVPELECVRWYPGARPHFCILSAHPFVKLQRSGGIPKEQHLHPRSTPSKSHQAQYDQIATQLELMNRYMSTYDEEQVPAPIPSATPSNKSRKVAPTVPLPTMAECRAFFEEWTSDLDCYALWKPRFLALAVDVQDSYDNELASDMATRQARAKTVVRRIKQHPDRASQKGFQVGLLNELHQLELDGVISRTTFDEDLFEAVKLARTEQELRNIYPEDVTLKLLAQFDVNVTQIEQARHEYAELCKTHAQTAEAFKPSISSTGLPTETELRARHRLGKSDLERLLQEEQEARGIADRCTLLQYVRQKLATEDEVKQFKAHEAALCRRYERENAERIADQRAFKWRNNAHYGWGLQQAVARQRGLAVTIDSAVAEALCQRPCFYCDEFPDDRNITSIDRLDSHVGYEPGNCVPCCQRCNWAKNAHTVDEFLQLVENIILHRRGEAGRFGFQRYLYRTTQPTLASYRIGAERRRREFLLTTSEFDGIVREPCHYCGIASGSNHWNGIDRIDSEGDYVTGNVVSACKPCNMMKNKWSMEGFFVHCEKIHARAQLIRENLKSI